jgi:hypothetical protein
MGDHLTCLPRRKSYILQNGRNGNINITICILVHNQGYMLVQLASDTDYDDSSEAIAMIPFRRLCRERGSMSHIQRDRV